MIKRRWQVSVIRTDYRIGTIDQVNSLQESRVNISLQEGERVNENEDEHEHGHGHNDTYRKTSRGGRRVVTASLTY